MECALNVGLKKIQEFVFMPVELNSGMRTLVFVGDKVSGGFDQKAGSRVSLTAKREFPAIDFSQIANCANQFHGACPGRI